MSVATYYVLLEHRRRALVTMRTVVLLALVMALAFFLAAFWPAKEFAETAAYAHARSDISVNGPLRQADITRIRRILPAGAASIPVYTGNLTSIEASGRVLEGTPAVLYPPASARDVLLTYFSPGLLLDGDMASDSSAGVDAVTAKRLHIAIGDILSYQQKVDANTAHNLHGSATVTAIFAPTNATTGVILPLRADLGRALAGSEKIIASDLFIRTGSTTSPTQTADALATLDGAQNWNITVVTDRLSRARKEVDGAASRPIRMSIVFGALLVYSIYVLRDQSARLDRRRRDVAIIISMGEPIGRFSIVFIAEQLALAATATVLGVWIADYVLGAYLHLYIPGQAKLSLGGLAIGVNLAIAIAIAFQLRHRLLRLPIPRILAAE